MCRTDRRDPAERSAEPRVSRVLGVHAAQQADDPGQCDEHGFRLAGGLQRTDGADAAEAVRGAAE